MLSKCEQLLQLLWNLQLVPWNKLKSRCLFSSSEAQSSSYLNQQLSGVWGKLLQEIWDLLSFGRFPDAGLVFCLLLLPQSLILLSCEWSPSVTLSSPRLSVVQMCRGRATAQTRERRRRKKTIWGEKAFIQSGWGLRVNQQPKPLLPKGELWNPPFLSVYFSDLSLNISLSALFFFYLCLGGTHGNSWISS